MVDWAPRVWGLIPAGKIALVDAVRPKINYAAKKRKALFYTDADNQIAA